MDQENEVEGCGEIDQQFKKNGLSIERSWVQFLEPSW